MPTIERTVTINAPANKIDKLMVDPAHAHEVWGADEAKPEGNWPEKGGKLHTVVKIAGIPMKMTLTVLKHVAGERHEQSIEGMMKGKMGWTFTPESDGASTQVDVNMEYNVPGGVLGPALDRLMFERAANATADRVTENAKKLAERDNTVGS